MDGYDIGRRRYFTKLWVEKGQCAQGVADGNAIRAKDADSEQEQSPFGSVMPMQCV